MDISFKSNILLAIVGAVVKDEKNINSGFEVGITRDLDNFNIEKVAQDVVSEALSHFNGEL